MRMAVSSSTCSAPERYSPETIACSISAPENPSAAETSRLISKRETSCPRFRRCSSMMPWRTGSLGKSIKKISSKRPLRINSAGSASIVFAVATKIPVFAFRHPGQQCPQHPSRHTFIVVCYAHTLSISSIHSTQGAICSASRNASRRFRSVSPWNLL